MKHILFLLAFFVGLELHAQTKITFTDSRHVNDYFDQSRGTFPGNDAFFIPENVFLKSPNKGPLVLQIAKQEMEDRKYTGAEVRMRSEYKMHLYGRYEVVMKAACQSGTVSAFFLYNSVPTWQEIDFELIGSKPNVVQTSYVFNGNLSDNGDPNNYHAKQFNVGVNTCKDFHKYAFEWDENELRFYFDGRLIDTRSTQNGDKIPNQSLNLYMNAWLNNSRGWAGPIDRRLKKTQMEVKEVLFP